ncbi:hypothetical protein CMUS01_03931 [Colletotrichum musicola]|uniref:Uncharacterized protein n=1 Tax=Colletotrichum musicola TaxID=2175873 RepID=A0A8H6NPY0_9PEZI|nr:hypothetical protein CMUS01_03931 [Colletotrichum musicola]
MAPLSPSTLLHALVAREGTGVISTCASADGPCVEVVCAWPLSGQYGFGQRVLYYILVVTCVIARKAKWMRAVCLAGALLVPAVAAVHGIILASMHVDNATDMDIYGALQFCSIGILAAPITVKLSSTFFYDPGRNIIFLWTGLILSVLSLTSLTGLLSLAVEFYRTRVTPCTGPSASRFPYGNATCNLTCTQDDGPFSLLRTEAASEIFVVPKPSSLPFGMAMFLAAAECIPAILSLVTMWNKILEINWKKGDGAQDEKGSDSSVITGTNGATLGGMKAVNQAIRSMLSAVEIPVFAGAWLAVLIIGEINFWSPQVRYHTEPIGSIGQWGTILATGMAGLGSLYVYLADDKQDLEEKRAGPCACTHCHHEQSDGVEVDRSMSPVSPRTSAVHREHRVGTADAAQGQAPDNLHGEYRRRMANWLGKVDNYFGNPSNDPFGAGGFQTAEWPLVPGEEDRNSLVSDRHSMMEGSTSHRGSRDDHSSSDEGTVAPTPASPTSPGSSMPSPFRTRKHANSFPSRRSSFERPATAAASNTRNGVSPARRATLEVPPSVHHRH